MRGKLRDKRPDTKRDNFKRELIERRRTNKREHHTIVWLNQQLDLEEENYLHNEEEVLLEQATK